MCVSGPGFEAAGLLYCSRWCTFSIYKKTLSVGSKEEVLSSIPASTTAEPLCGSTDGHVVLMHLKLAQFFVLVTFPKLHNKVRVGKHFNSD